VPRGRRKRIIPESVPVQFSGKRVFGKFKDI
jgi:hypothetical protein